VQQADGGRGAAAQVPGDLGHRPALQVMQLQRYPLGFREQGQGFGQAEELLVVVGLLARRGLLGRQPGLQPGRGLGQGRLQGALPGHVAPGPVQVAAGVGQVAGQDLAQPGGQLGLGLAPELRQGLVGLQQRLLDQVGGVQLGPQPRVQLQPGQQA
jgi:hypothetical protein